MAGVFAIAVNGALASPFFGIALTIGAFMLGKRIAVRIKSPLANPFVIALIVVVATLKGLGIPLEYYQNGGDLLSLMLVPATAILGTTVYRQRALLRANFLPILAGCLAGAATSILSVYFLCQAFGVGESLMLSLLPKSVTTPIAMELAELSGGLVPLAIATVAATGIFGVIFAQWVLRLLGFDDPIVVGISIGTASHVIGTAKAIEIGETEGAASGVAICITGIATVAVYLIFLL